MHAVAAPSRLLVVTCLAIQNPVIRSRLSWICYPWLVYGLVAATVLFAGSGVLAVAAAATRMLVRHWGRVVCRCASPHPYTRAPLCGLQADAGVDELAWANGQAAFGPSFAVAATGTVMSLASAVFLHLA